MSKLDFWFPFFVLLNGFIMVLVTEYSFFRKLAQERGIKHYSSLESKKPLAWMFFWVGGLWSLQNLWYLTQV